MKRTSRAIKHLSINILVASASVYLTTIWQKQHQNPAQTRNPPQQTASVSPPPADVEPSDSEGWIPVSEAEADEVEMDYDARWTAIVNSDESESEKVKKLTSIALTMAVKGHTIEAFEKSMKAYGPGEARCGLINGIFSGAKDVADLESCFSKLEFDDERDYASHGLAFNLTQKSAPDKIDFSRFQYLGGRLDSMIARNVETYIFQRAVVGQVDTSKVFADSMSVGMSDTSRKSVIGTLTPIIPFDCWDHLEKRGLGTLEIDTDRVISCMVNIDPREAIEKISPQLSVADSFNTVFQAWMKKDASQPIAWLNENAKNLSSVQKDRACQGIAYYAAKQGDFAVARQWSDRIVEPSIKEEIAKNAWFSENSSK
jgi:hypothetical protein